MAKKYHSVREKRIAEMILQMRRRCKGTDLLCDITYEQVDEKFRDLDLDPEDKGSYHILCHGDKTISNLQIIPNCITKRYGIEDTPDNHKIVSYCTRKHSSAKGRGIECSLTPKDIIALLDEAGITIDDVLQGKKENRYLLGRYGPDIGPYEMGNCRFITWSENVLESNMTYQQTTILNGITYASQKEASEAWGITGINHRLKLMREGNLDKITWYSRYNKRMMEITRS